MTIFRLCASNSFLSIFGPAGALPSHLSPAHYVRACVYPCVCVLFYVSIQKRRRNHKRHIFIIDTAILKVKYVESGVVLTAIK